MKRSPWRPAGAVLSALLAGPIGAPASADDDLLFHAETLAGGVLASSGAAEAVNPASVAKIATALFALETLGAGHRYETAFALAGALDRRSGVLDGDLLVIGGDDPDFHFESALLVARRLEELGVRSVTGTLRVDRRFWIGWERGSEGRDSDPDRRVLTMAERLRRALDPSLWTAEQHRSWADWRRRAPELPGEPPSIEIGRAGARRDGETAPADVLYRSNPLPAILKRFLAYSNNDIERIADPLGGAPAVERFLEERVGLAAGSVSLATSSGLGSNRMAPADVVLLLRRLHQDLAALGLDPTDLLPVPGCDPGSLEHALPLWRAGPLRAATAAKTGTLIRQDGGVAALAGYLYGRDGTALYMVAAPRSGHRIVEARTDIEAWTARLADRLGGPSPRPCGAPVVPVDAQVEIGAPLAAASAE